MNMIRSSGADLTAGSDVSSVPVFTGIHVSGFCRHLLHTGLTGIFCALEWVVSIFYVNWSGPSASCLSAD